MISDRTGLPLSPRLKHGRDPADRYDLGAVLAATDVAAVEQPRLHVQEVPAGALAGPDRVGGLPDLHGVGTPHDPQPPEPLVHQAVLLLHLRTLEPGGGAAAALDPAARENVLADVLH